MTQNLVKSTYLRRPLNFRWFSGRCSHSIRFSSGTFSMNCLSEFGARQSVVYKGSRARANHQHCFIRQTSINVRNQALRRSPLPASKAHQKPQARSKQRRLVRCQSSQVAGPGQWGQAVRCFSCSAAFAVPRSSQSTKPFALQADHNVVLVADIGGTNCRFVLWRLDLQTGNHEKLFSKVSRSLLAPRTTNPSPARPVSTIHCPA